MRVDELEKLILALTKKIQELEAKPVTKIEAPTDKKVKAIGLKKDAPRHSRWGASGVWIHAPPK